MPKEQTNLDAMRELAESCELTFHVDYSGRGMLGMECIGVSGSEGDLWRFALLMGSELSEELMIALEEPPSKDNMGHQTIWYWPRLRVSNIDA